MGFRFRRSFGILPGVRINLSKHGVGISAGVPGARVSLSPTGRVTGTASIPGTGLSMSERLDQPASRRSTRTPRASADGLVSANALTGIPPQALPPKPWIFASEERALWQAMVDGDGDVLLSLAAGDGEAAVAASVYASSNLAAADQSAAAAALLLRIWNGPDSIDSDPIAPKYFSNQRVTLPVTPVVEVPMPIDGLAVGLIIAELLQDNGDLEGALRILGTLPDTPVTALSRADVLCALSRWSDAIAVTDGIENNDDVTAMAIIYRALAFRGLGEHTAARTCLAAALRSRARLQAVRHIALGQRALLNIEVGQLGRAKADLERLRAEDANHPLVAEIQSRLTAPA